jgi:hypothetical protein
MVLVAQICANLDDGQGDFVSQASWLHSQVTIIQFWMAATLTNEFDIGEAHPNAVDANQELIVARFWDWKWFRSAVPPDVFNTRAIHIPGPALFGHFYVGRMIAFIFCCHSYLYGNLPDTGW